MNNHHYLSCEHLHIKDVEFAITIHSKLIQFNRFPNGKVHTCLFCSRHDSKLIQVDIWKHYEQTGHPIFMKVSRPCELYCTICGDYQFCSLFDHRTDRKRENKAEREEKSKLPKIESPPELLVDNGNLIAKGLTNMGSTCFMNSVLQVLCHNRNFTGCPQLSFHFNACPITNKFSTRTSSDMTASSSSSSQLTTCIPCEFYKVYRDLRFQNQNENAVIPSSLLYAIWNLIDYMVGYAQQDAHEFLLALLNGIECQIAIENTPYVGPALDKLYAGELESSLTCQNCHDVSKTTQNFVDINLSLEGNSLSDEAVRLEDCLGVFTMEEILSDTMMCEKCGVKQTKSKQLKILKAPNMLIIHLKRFDFLKNKKILKTVLYSPDSLNISQYCVNQDKTVEYEPVGVICHEGTLNQGHYISFVKEGSTWLRCDDESVTITTDADVAKSEAYILFYQRKI